MVLLAAPLVVICLVLLFKVGQAAWPSWLVMHRKPVLGLLLLGTAVLVFLAPLILEVKSNFRPLSGPGKNPELDWWK